MLREVADMKRNKLLLLVLFCFLAVFAVNSSLIYAAPAKDAKYSVDAQEIEYDMESGDGTTTGKTTIKHDGGTAVGQKGSTFNSKKRTGHLYGGVTAEKQDQRLRSQELFIYSDKYYSAVGDAVVIKGGKKLEAPRVDFHDDTRFAETLGGSARLTDTDGSWLRAGKITYDMKAGLANATGGVSLESKPRKLTGTGDTAVYNTNETGYIELIGNAVAVQDGNTITGDKLRITNVSGKNSKSHAQGNVKIVFVPKEDNNRIDNPAFGDGVVLMANGQTNFNPKYSMLDYVQGMSSDTEERET
jgi:lipopolysaccharide export system protein LptA